MMALIRHQWCATQPVCQLPTAVCDSDVRVMQHACSGHRDRQPAHRPHPQNRRGIRCWQPESVAGLRAHGVVWAVAAGGAVGQTCWAATSVYRSPESRFNPPTAPSRLVTRVLISRTSSFTVDRSARIMRKCSKIRFSMLSIIRVYYC